MNKEILHLAPKKVWNNFSKLNAIPRASKKEARIVAFMVDFGKQLGLETFTDATGNVIIRKRATKGMENRKTVTLQSHLDMVHQKNQDIQFDFDQQGIQMVIQDDWVKAMGTTLGADNGIGVAAIMAVLESDDIPHPAIEALFTVDEETGMTGAFGLEPGILQGELLLNLDTEEDDELDIGCAGGIDVNGVGSYKQQKPAPDTASYKVVVKGLRGGHSGMDIHKGLGNANKLMNRILYHLSEQVGVRVAMINGGGLRNAIPRESTAVVVLPATNIKTFEKELMALSRMIKDELKIQEPALEISFSSEGAATTVMPIETQKKLLRALYTAHNGVYAMSAEIPNLVETSNNMARVLVAEGKILVNCLTRSSVESAKMDMAESLRAAFELANLKVEFAGSYPGWKPNPNSEILKLAKSTYQTLFGEAPKVVACHAGLECGILGSNYPNLEMISFGPTILGAHSPDERVSITSVQKFWRFLVEILEQIPERA